MWPRAIHRTTRDLCVSLAQSTLPLAQSTLPGHFGIPCDLGLRLGFLWSCGALEGQPKKLARHAFSHRDATSYTRRSHCGLDRGIPQAFQEMLSDFGEKGSHVDGRHSTWARTTIALTALRRLEPPNFFCCCLTWMAERKAMRKPRELVHGRARNTI